MTDDATKPEARGLTGELRRVIAVVLWGPFMTQMDSTVVNVSLSTIRQDLHASISGVQWVISGYLLALALVLPLNGWLVDRVGAKRLYLACFAAFTLASLGCGSATTIEGLIGARVLQGAAGGLLAPMTAMMIARVAGQHLARAMGYIAVPVLLAPIMGPVLAGAILKFAHWSWLFYINLPVGLFALALAAYLLPTDAAVRQRRSFDGLGFVLLSPGLGCLLFGLEEATHGQDGWVLCLGVLLLACFAWHAVHKKSDALLDMSLFANASFRAATRTQFLANGVTYAGQFLVPLYLTTGHGLSAAQTGWLMAPMGVGMMCSQPSMGFLTEKYGCRAVASSGVFLSIIGTLPFLWMVEGRFSPTLVAVCLLMRGAGQGATGIPSSSVAYGAVPKEKLAVGATAINIVQRLGGPVATTLMGIVVSLSGRHLLMRGPDAFLLPFFMLLALQAVLLASAWRLPFDAQASP